MLIKPTDEAKNFVCFHNWNFYYNVEFPKKICYNNNNVPNTICQKGESEIEFV